MNKLSKSSFFFGSFGQSLPGCFPPQLALLLACDGAGHDAAQCPDWLCRAQNQAPVMTAGAVGLYAPWPRKGRLVLVDGGLLD